MSGAPISTYRLQITPEFTFQDATRLVPYLERLGVSHAFISPILQAAPGSMHGYDVVDHSRVSMDNGGEEDLRGLADALHKRGMGLIVDVVPNHMAIPTPMWHNHALWSFLRDGASSPYASWFDSDPHAEHGILLPVLGRPIGATILDDELRRGTAEVPQPDGSRRIEHVLRYFDHVFPLAEGTENLPIVDLLEAQHYRLAYWRVANDELNYRRFFDVQTLAAVKVEDRAVFDATHATLLRLQSEGVIDGYRIDHPDGLADPRGYLRRLESATGGAWTVIEKILEGNESLPPDFPVAGTTGYDALWRVQGLFHDPAGAAALTHTWRTFTHDSRSFDEITHASAKEVIDTSLWAEIARLVDLARRICDADIMLRDTTERQLEHAIIQLLMAMDRYRAYIVPGEKAPRVSARCLPRPQIEQPWPSVTTRGIVPLSRSSRHLRVVRGSSRPTVHSIRCARSLSRVSLKRAGRFTRNLLRTQLSTGTTGSSQSTRWVPTRTALAWIPKSFITSASGCSGLSPHR